MAQQEIKLTYCFYENPAAKQEIKFWESLVEMHIVSKSFIGDNWGYRLEKEDGTMESRIYEPGQGWCVPLKTKHRVIAVTDYTALECSTAHLNDCIRFEDDSDRGSGKIESEHEGN